MATWNMVFYEGIANARSILGMDEPVPVYGRRISSKQVTVGTTPVVVPPGTKIIRIIPLGDTDNGYFWAGPGVTATAAEAQEYLAGAHGPVDIGWSNDWSFVHAEAVAV